MVEGKTSEMHNSTCFPSLYSDAENAPISVNIRESRWENAPSCLKCKSQPQITETDVHLKYGSNVKLFTLCLRPPWLSGKAASKPEDSRFGTRLHCGSAVFVSLLHVKSDVGQTFSHLMCCGSLESEVPLAGVVQKYPHWPCLPKKSVRPVEDQWGESRSTIMWRKGFIGYNKMIQALPEQGQYF
ncbi:hypothetical protein AVEN_25391-1 [Araneus ventricosus]|uniref:Uncharacterized protein n=1 Tax=Araneus ventricosus TaxID=182803 RepID=A0A4Y2TJ23_ARAVE|nr:hypothetical protein AVEN_25391-1 [Araneus ventricosus]